MVFIARFYKTRCAYSMCTAATTLSSIGQLRDTFIDHHIYEDTWYLVWRVPDVTVCTAWRAPSSHRF